MGTWIDVAIIAIVVIFAIVGIYKGFIEYLLKFIGSVGAILLAFFGARPVASFLDNIFHFTKPLGDVCLNWLSGSVPQDMLDTVLDASTKETFINKISEDGLTIPESFIKSIVDGVNVDAGQTFGNVIATGMGTIFASILTGIVLFLVIKFIIFLLARLFESKESISISGINRALGMVVGIAKGVLIVLVAYTILTICCMIFPIDVTINEYVNQTTLFKATYAPYSEMIQNFINDKMANFVSNLTANMIANA